MDAKEKTALSLIQKDESYSNYFFQRVKDPKWFSSLKERAFFDPKKISFVETDARFWNVMDYLERISEQVAAGLETKYASELLTVIGDIVRFSRETRPINHMHIWWYCVKIVNNLPVAMIKANVPIEDQPDGSVIKYGFRSWLLTWTDPSLGGDLALTDTAEKLLPKFLKDDAALEYAEAIVDVITRVKASGKKTSLGGEDHAVLVCESYWVSDAFQKYAKLIGEKCSAGLIYNIADKLEAALEYRHQAVATEIAFGKDIYKLSIARVALDGLKSGEIGFKSGVYQCILKQYTRKQTEGVDLETNFAGLWNIEPQSEVARFSIEAATRDDFVLKVRGSLPASVPWNSAAGDGLEKRLAALFNGFYEDYSNIWCRSLATGPQHKNDAEDILTAILRDILLSKCEANREEGQKVLSGFWGERYRFPIFRRMVLLCADRYWADYPQLVVRFLELTPTAFQDSDYEVELQDALGRHWNELSPTLLERLKALIKNVPEYYLQEGEEATAYWKYKWLSPLREHLEFSGAYDEAKKKVQPKGGKPYEPKPAFSGGVVVHKSPIPKEEIVRRLAVGELVKYLNEFQGADFWHGTFEGEPDKDGLMVELQEAVKVEPMAFAKAIKAFHQVHYSYVNAVLLGLKEAWKQGKELGSNDWEQIFQFCLAYLSSDREAFLKEAMEAQGGERGDRRYIQLLGTIVDLIAEGCRDDKRAFDPQHFAMVEKIFDAVLPFLASEPCSNIKRDALTYALNTTAGKTVESYIVFSLRAARATGKKQENWGIERYERFFAAGLVETYIWFGCLLPNMRYLDERYTDDKIRAFAQPTTDDYHWQKFMEGYLSGSQLDGKLYALMRPHYLKALQRQVFEGDVEEKFVDHLCIGYLWGLESLQESNPGGQPSLLWKMLDEANSPEKRGRWLQVAKYFWQCTTRTVRKEEKNVEEAPSEAVKKKILDFWAWTYKEQEFVKNRLGDEYDKFLGHMSYLTLLLGEIDQEKEGWLLLCAPHVDENHGSAFFLEYLTTFRDEESVKRIGKIFHKVLEHTTPTFRQEDIELIVERLYEAGQKDPAVKWEADEICNTYGRRGHHFLKPLWDKHQKGAD